MTKYTDKSMLHLDQTHRERGLILPQAPMPVGNYLATISSGNLLFISGQLPFRDGKLFYKGKLGKDLTVTDGVKAAELCALNILSHINKTLQKNRFKQIIKLEGFINCTDSFTEHAKVLNGASDILSSLLSDQAGHVRTVTGCNSLPLGAAIELAAIVECESNTAPEHNGF